MQVLQPLGSSTDPAGPVTVLITRSVAAEEEEGFLRALREVEDAPKGLLFRRVVPAGVEFSILHRFASAAEHEAWLASPVAERWRQAAAPPVPSADHVRRYSGVESLFVTARAPQAPPLWKMTTLMVMAAYPLSLLMATSLGPRLADLPPWLGALVTTVGMVAAMTYVLVPLLTRLFEGWLAPPDS